MSNHSPHIRSTLDRTSPCLRRQPVTRCTIRPVDCGDKWTIRSSLLAIPINRLKCDDCSVAITMTAKVKKPLQHRCAIILDTIKVLFQPKIKVHAQYNTPSLAPKKGAISQVDINHLTWASKSVSGQRSQGRREKHHSPLARLQHGWHNEFFANKPMCSLV